MNTPKTKIPDHLRLRWVCCGEGREDRAGHIGPKEMIQIQKRHNHAGYTVRFMYNERAKFEDIEEAKQYAQANIGAWIAEREAAKARDEAATLERRAAEEARTQRLASVIAQLRALGLEVNDGMGFVALRPEAAEALVQRLAAPVKVQAIPQGPDELCQMLAN